MYTSSVATTERPQSWAELMAQCVDSQVVWCSIYAPSDEERGAAAQEMKKRGLVVDRRAALLKGLDSVQDELELLTEEGSEMLPSLICERIAELEGRERQLLASLKDEQMPGGECQACGTKASELCGDLMCRDCHKSLTFEDCISGAWVARHRAGWGLG